GGSEVAGHAAVGAAHELAGSGDQRLLGALLIGAGELCHGRFLRRLLGSYGGHIADTPRQNGNASAGDLPTLHDIAPRAVAIGSRTARIGGASWPKQRKRP